MSEASSPRFFSAEFKIRLLLRLQAGESVATLARENRVAPQLIYEWREAYRVYGAAGLNRKRGRKAGWRPPSAADLARAKARIAELERVLGRQQADLHATSRSGGAPASMRSSKR